MGSDASIYSMIRPKAPSQGPMEGMGQMLQIRHMMDQGQLGDLQRKQLERSMAEDDAYKAAVSGMQPGQTIRDILPAVMKASPTKGLALHKQVGEQDQAAAALDKTRTETHALKVKAMRDQLAAVTDDVGLAAATEAAVKLYGFKAAQSFPQSVNDPRWKEFQASNVRDATAFLKHVEPMYETVNLGGTSRVIQKNPNAAGATVGDMQRTLTPGEVQTGAHQAAVLKETKAEHGRVAERAKAVADAGKWTNDLANGVQVNMATGETRPITTNGEPIQKSPKLTEDQGKATGWLVQADNAFKNMQAAMVADPESPRPGKFTSMIAALPSAGLGETVANSMRGKERQKFMQGASSLSEALLRAATGAGVNKEEAAQKIAELTPKIGDDQELVKQKMDAIPLYIESLKVRAGPGAEQLPGIVKRGAPAAPPTTAEIQAELRRRGVAP